VGVVAAVVPALCRFGRVCVSSVAVFVDQATAHARSWVILSLCDNQY